MGCDAITAIIALACCPMNAAAAAAAAGKALRAAPPPRPAVSTGMVDQAGLASLGKSRRTQDMAETISLLPRGPALDTNQPQVLHTSTGCIH